MHIRKDLASIKVMCPYKNHKKKKKKGAYSPFCSGMYHCSPHTAHFVMQVSLIPRLSCVGGEKRVWYTLFAQAENLEISVKSALLH